MPPSRYGLLSKMKKCAAYLLTATCVFLVAFVGYLNVHSITGAFGEGAPYYGRTTNMDKWENPVPIAVAVDAAVLAFVFLAGRWAFRQIR